VINLDPIIMEWISGNWLATTIALGLLKGLAILTPTAKDDKIHQLLSGLFGTLRGGKKS